MLTDGLESFGLLVEYCDVFINCLDSHTNGTRSLQMIHYWASDVILKPTYILDGLRASMFSANFHFKWTLPSFISIEQVKA